MPGRGGLPTGGVIAPHDRPGSRARAATMAGRWGRPGPRPRGRSGSAAARTPITAWPIGPVVDGVHSFEDAGAAFRRFGNRENFGKVVITTAGGEGEYR